MLRPVCPCGKCEKKGCGAYHSICEKYLDYRAGIEEYRKWKAAEWDKQKKPRSLRTRGRKEY